MPPSWLRRRPAGPARQGGPLGGFAPLGGHRFAPAIGPRGARPPGASAPLRGKASGGEPKVGCTPPLRGGLPPSATR